MEDSQVYLNGQRFMQDGRPLILGISPGNSFYYKKETLKQLFDFAARKNPEQVLLFVPDKISEHNYRAIGSKKPETTARLEGNRLRNKCNEAIQGSTFGHTNYTFIRWTEDVESCHEYEKALADIKDLYEANDEFGTDIRESTEVALRYLRNGREKEGCSKEKEPTDTIAVDLNEGVLYPLKELAFLVAVPSIYRNCKEFVFVYHRPWPVMEKYFNGCYDGTVKPSLGFCRSVFE